ncbi:integrase core domain-containing protein [Pseudovibrio japonicus]|uniref:integrase core domain-containing protein n=1 Tax=Pseudovibrio japonicus TaxID=366534 RepID=UPI001679F04F|nr:integrase core domain-containing protein [Pseudovibrio japonicus]
MRTLKQIIEWRGKPTVSRADNRPDNIQTRRFKPGMPAQNAYVEQNISTVRQEWHDQVCFEGIKQAQAEAKNWLRTYSNKRPAWPLMEEHSQYN